MFYSLMTNQLHQDKLSTTRLYKMVGMVLAGGLFFGIDSALAAPILTGELIKNGTFGATGTPQITSLEFWTKTVDGVSDATVNTPGTNNIVGGPINARQSGNTINDSVRNIGFGKSDDSAAKVPFFTSPFAVLGDTTGPTGTSQITQNDAPNSGIFSIHQDFTLEPTVSGQAISGYDLNLSLNAVFDGRDSLSAILNDIFSVTLINLNDSSKHDFISRNSTGLPPACGPSTACTNVAYNQINFDGTDPLNPNSFTLLNWKPGDYRLELKLVEIATLSTLVEPDDLTNTAVGIDDVSLSGIGRIAAAPTIPEPSLPLLLGFAMALLGWSRKFTAK